MIELDPEPTPKMQRSGCEIQACPCKALGRAADAWGAAAQFVRALDQTPSIIELPKRRRR